mgnify:CR=1 FL=1
MSAAPAAGRRIAASTTIPAAMSAACLCCHPADLGRLFLLAREKQEPIMKLESSAPEEFQGMVENAGALLRSIGKAAGLVGNTVWLAFGVALVSAARENAARPK